MRILRSVALTLAMVLLALGSWQALRAQDAPRITGTYTNMSYIEEAGDVVGEELKIVVVQGGCYQGALQFAEGEPEGLLVVNIEVKGNAISFAVPAGDTHAGRFSGTVSGGALHGEFRFERGGVEKVTLKKGKSYWD